MNKRLILALALAFVPACGSSDPKVLTDEGAKALNSGKYEEAAKSYEKAVTQLGSETTNPEWLRAHIGLVTALAHTDAPRAKKEFLDLAAAAPSKVTDKEYSRVASALADADHFPEATEVLTAGRAAYKESVALQSLLDDIGKRAEARGDTGAVDALKGLGYSGGK